MHTSQHASHETHNIIYITAYLYKFAYIIYMAAGLLCLMCSNPLVHCRLLELYLNRGSFGALIQGLERLQPAGR